MPAPDFDSLCDELTRLGADKDTHPAELHGLACGFLAAGFQPSADHWLQEAADYAHQPAIATTPATEQGPLVEIYTLSQAQLGAGDFEFQLCLPDDEIYGLAERSESLARWCQGFLHGFAAVQSPLTDEDQELLRDLTEISRLAISTDDLEEGEDEAEGYYAELTEFVRMAAIGLFMDHSRPNNREGDAHVHH